MSLRSQDSYFDPISEARTHIDFCLRTNLTHPTAYELYREIVGATLILAAARAQWKVQLAEKQLSTCLAEEHVALTQLHEFQAKQAD
jgi:hypothetical protein